ncbi:hypothetical protein I7I48_00468 [Histoplasma ohiense]|nr:hypothetical protein I7I48_00468 [Histoplasma ohiense (nom. inval.)]
MHSLSLPHESRSIYRSRPCYVEPFTHPHQSASCTLRVVKSPLPPLASHAKEQASGDYETLLWSMM